MKPPYGKYKETEWRNVPRHYIRTLLMNQDKGELVEQAKSEVKRREEVAKEQTSHEFIMIGDHWKFCRQCAHVDLVVDIHQVRTE